LDGTAAPALAGDLSPAGLEATEHGFPLSSKRFANVRSYNNRPLVDVREFYEKDGVLSPGAKGLSLNPAQWSALRASLVSLSDALGRRDETFVADLGSGKRVSISSYSGKWLVDLREYYERDGQMRPGKKGISLPPDQWAKLCAVEMELTRRLEAMGGGTSTAAAPSPAPAHATDAGPSSAGPGPGPGAVTGSPAPAATADSSVVLGPNRRAETSRYKGTMYLSIREYYEKDGQMLPGKKGISLNKEQADALVTGAAALTAALTARDESFALELSSK
jgi:hypothetical protein